MRDGRGGMHSVCVLIAYKARPQGAVLSRASGGLTFAASAKNEANESPLFYLIFSSNGKCWDDPCIRVIAGIFSRSIA